MCHMEKTLVKLILLIFFLLNNLLEERERDTYVLQLWWLKFSGKMYCIVQNLWSPVFETESLLTIHSRGPTQTYELSGAVLERWHLKHSSSLLSIKGWDTWCSLLTLYNRDGYNHSYLRGELGRIKWNIAHIKYLARSANVLLFY